MDDGRAASAAVMAASGALTAAGGRNLRIVYAQRPREVPFSFAYFSFGQAKEK